MKMKLVTVIVTAFGLSTSPALLGQGCCGGGGAMKEGCSMGGTEEAGGHAGHGAGGAAAETAAVKPVFGEPVQSVFDNYIKVQGALVHDSLGGVAGASSAMAKAIQGDAKRTLSLAVAQQSAALAKAKDLEAARAAFKPLSESLIQFAEGQKAAAGTYHVAYCPMAKASWLQTGKTVMNPYMGKAMPHCGQLKS